VRIALFSLATLCAGCIPVTDFDPVGGAAAISGSWLIDGAAPTEESCRALAQPFVDPGAEPAIPRVRVAFLDGQRSVPHSGLVFECVQDCSDDPECSPSAFDTRDNFVLAVGDWVARLEAIDGAGRVIATGPNVSAAVTASTDRVELPAVTFWSAMISAHAVIDGSTPSAQSCDSAGIALVQLSFEAATGEIGGRGMERCAAGGVGTRVQPGDYTVRLRALDEGGGLVGETVAETFSLGQGDRTYLNGGEPIELTSL
jgi:hypothetical protein